MKKGRSRTRKPRATVAAQATPEPLEEQLPGTLATWVRVGPGKFVRADAAPSFLDVERAPTPSDPSLTTEPEPAASPGAGIVGSETEGKGEDLGITESQEALNLAEGHAPEAAVETSPEDNGNAPDASEELALSRRESVIEPPDRGFEPILDVAIEPETVAVTEPSPDAPPRPSVSCPEASTSADENVSADLGCPAEVDREPLPLSAAATVNQDRPRARSSIWSSASFWRALSRSRMPAQATTAKGSRPLPGNVRSIYPDSRVRTGPDRSPRRGREIGRSHPTERDHPPRSPPTRAGFRKGVGDLQHRPSTKSEGAAPFERPDAALRRLTIVRMKGHFSRLIVNAPQAPQSPQLSPPL